LVYINCRLTVLKIENQCHYFMKKKKQLGIRKLSLSKKTISFLDANSSAKFVGGDQYGGASVACSMGCPGTVNNVATCAVNCTDYTYYCQVPGQSAGPSYDHPCNTGICEQTADCFPIDYTETCY
jgi:hypothetical protein